jgi:transglutaminase superfamily protein
MIAEAIPDAYDAAGKKVFRPFDRSKGIRPSFPLGRYISHPLAINCESIDEVRQFLRGCRQVSDKELFDKDDYWQPPEDFERMKKGDCEDFAFWTWRQFMDLGFDARVVFGRVGRYGAGHAWVQFVQDGKCFIVEPTRAFLGASFPRLTTLSYQPKYSVAWDGEKLTYFAHQNMALQTSFRFQLSLVPEYASFWAWFWLRNITRIHRVAWNLSRRFVKSFHWTRNRKPL